MKALKNEIVTLNYKGVELDIKGTYYPAQMSADYYTPPEPEMFEIDEIKICSFDAYELLDFQIEDIETEILKRYE